MDPFRYVIQQVVELCRGCRSGTDECDKEGPLGMEDGRIADTSITASSIWQNKPTHAQQRARLNTQGYAGAWCAEASEKDPWIQVDFQSPVRIIALITQGRSDYQQWVTEFQLACSEDGKVWTDVADSDGAPIKFPGNTDQDTQVTNTLPTPATTRYLRIKPTEWKTNPSLRFEVIGCRHDD